LIKRGCSPTHVTKSKQTVLHKVAIFSKGEDSLEVAQYLIKRGCSVNCQDISGKSVLHFLAMFNEGINRLELAKMFIKHGCSVNLLTESQESVLHYVAQYSEGDSKLELAKLFISHGCNVNFTEKKFKRSVLHFAVRDTDNIVLMRFLLGHSNLSCLNEVDWQNRTPYWYVVNNKLPVWFGGGSCDYEVPNRQEMIELFATNGATL